MQVQTGIEKVLNFDINPDVTIKKEINVGKLAEIVKIEETVCNEYVFNIVK